MSGFMRGSGLNAQMLRAAEDIRLPIDNWGFTWGPQRVAIAPWEDGCLWPNSRGSQGAYYFGNDAAGIGRWGMHPPEGGSQSMLKFRGFTRDSTGAIVGNAVVQVFRTATDQFVREVTSDAGGYFELPSEFASTTHYLVAYKAGSPDIAGTSVNTIQPS